jgi:hypothetical protein
MKQGHTHTEPAVPQRRRRTPAQRWIGFGARLALIPLALDLLNLAQAPPFAAAPAKLTSAVGPVTISDAGRSATLPDGRTVTLTGVGGFSKDRVVWWGSDGRLAPRLPDSSLRLAGLGENSTHAISLRITGGRSRPLDTLAEPAGDGSFSAVQSGSTSWVNDEPDIRAWLYARASAPGLRGLGSLRFGVASARTFTVAEEPLPGRFGRRRGAPLGVRWDVSAFPNNAAGMARGRDLSVSLTVPRAWQEGTRGAGRRFVVRPVAVDWLGRQHLPSSWGGPQSGPYQATFRGLPPEMACSVRLIAAPMEWVEFRGLPLGYDTGRETPLRAFPVTPVAVERAWTDLASGGRGEVVRADAPFPSAQITRPVSGALVIGVARPESFDGSARPGTVFAVHAPDVLTLRPFNLVVLDVRGKETVVPLSGTVNEPGMRYQTFETRDVNPEEVRSVSVRVLRRD